MMRITRDESHRTIILDFEDICEMDMRLAWIIYAMLMAMKPHAIENRTPIPAINKRCLDQLDFGFPEPEEELRRLVGRDFDEMIWTFANIAAGNHISRDFDKHSVERLDRGLALFARYFKSLWF